MPRRHMHNQRPCCRPVASVLSRRLAALWCPVPRRLSTLAFASDPANDKQAAARVWRDGQQKRCYLYRMLCAGGIEEKVFERQLSKEGLAGLATNEQVRAVRRRLTRARLTSFVPDESTRSKADQMICKSHRASFCALGARGAAGRVRDALQE